MKLVRLLAVAALLSQSMAAVADEKCRLINRKPDREACYTRQDEARAMKLKANEATKRAAAETAPRMIFEDEKLSRTLRSICRGC